MNTKSKIIVFIIVIAVLIGGLIFLSTRPRTPGKYDQFATCLKDKGATFYGAFWCPHCQKQKQMFGKSATLLPYHECSTADGKSQLQSCVDKKIEGYPTWEFADGSRLTGEIELQTLAEKTSCELPAEETK